MNVRVVIADDHPMYRYGLGAVLAQSDQITVLETVGDGNELLRAVGEHHPDVVITDLSMPGLDGVAVTRQLLSDLPGVAVLVLTMHEDDEHVFAAMRAGASGYLVKGADGEEIERAVLAVAGGDAVYGGPVARRIVSFYAGVGRDPGLSGPDPDGARGVGPCWPPDVATTRSPDGWGCRTRRFATTSRRCCSSSRLRTVPRRHSRPRTQASDRLSTS